LKVAYDPSIGWWWQAWEDMKKGARILPLTGFVARDEITGAAHPLLISMFRGELTPEELYEKVREVALPLIEEAKKSG
jgi:hypothetical protein